MVKKPRNRAAQDSTLINIRALKKRVMTLEKQVAVYIAVVKKFQRIYEVHMKAHR